MPATVTDRFSLGSTDGPVEHIRIECTNRHHFMAATDSILRRPSSRLRAVS
jgi:hypothetical protein